MGKKKKQKRNVELPDDAELLAELATIDEATARIPTSTEHDSGVVPPWCELILEVRRDAKPNTAIALRDGLNAAWCLRRHDGELIIEVLDQVLHPQYNVRGVEAIWTALDAVVDRIQYMVNQQKHPNPEDIGEARGLATAVAMYTNPRSPDTDAVRAEAMYRWDVRNGLDEG